MKHSGKIISHDFLKGCGVISMENGQLLSFCSDDICQEAKLLPEKIYVSFNIVSCDEGLKAINITSVKKRKRGKIISFIEGKGIIEDESGTPYQFTAGDIKHAIKNPQEGNAVEFKAGKKDNELKAWKVICDNNSALAKFCSFALADINMEQLSMMAAPENWNYLNMEGKKLPVLKSYIEHTFEYAFAQNRIGYIQNPKQKKSYACFNTGLVTGEGEEIYGVFGKKTFIGDPSRLEQKGWMFSYFTDKWMALLLQCDKAPTAPSYYRHPEELVFNTGAEIILKEKVLAVRHIPLMPASFFMYDTKTLIEKVHSRVLFSLKKLRDGETHAVAKVYKGAIEFVAPLFLKDDRCADLALVIRHSDGGYKCTVMLPLDSAYKGARLLGPVKSDWLKPLCCFSELPVEQLPVQAVFNF